MKTVQSQPSLPGADDFEVTRLKNVLAAEAITRYCSLIAKRGCKKPPEFTTDEERWFMTTLAEILRGAATFFVSEPSASPESERVDAILKRIRMRHPHLRRHR